MTDHYPIREDDANCPCEGGYWYDEDTGAFYRCGCGCHLTVRCHCGAELGRRDGPYYRFGAWHHFDGTPCVGTDDYTS